METPKSRDSVISRVGRILAAFDHGRSRLSLTALARRTGLPLTTTHRLVAELERHGLIERDSQGNLRLGVQLWELASRGSHVSTLGEIATPFMRDVLEAVGQHTTLAILDRDSVLYIERLSSPRSKLEAARIAERMPIHASSSGLVLLAFSDPALQEEILSGPLEKETPYTETDPMVLRRMLAEIRRAGYVAPPSVGRTGWLGVAVPVFWGDRSIAAALNAIVPLEGTHAHAHTQAQTVIPALRTAASGISRELAHHPEARRPLT